MAVVAIIFLLMFIFYVRFTPKMAMLIVLTALAFMLKIPYVVPVACGLLLTPISSVPVAFGTVAYYMIKYAKETASALKEAEEASFIGDIGGCARAIFQNKEMWVTVIAFIICVLVVYNVKRLSIAHPWKAAIIAGTVVNIIFIAVGGIAFGVHASYGALLGGSVVAVIVGFVLEVVFFCVDYSRSETIQYEDDEYYYYVKAVPKITVAAPDKQVKKITAREDLSDETQIIDDDGEARKEKPKKRKKTRMEEPVIEDKREVKLKGTVKGEKRAPRTNTKKRAPKAKSSRVPGNTEHLLLTQSLEKDLKLNKKKK